MRLSILAAVTSLLFLSACATTSQLVSFAKSTPADAEVTLQKGDSRVGTYISSWKGFRTSSYWIEGPTGLILIDTQFLLSATEEMVNWAEQVTGKKAVLAIILHPNPDKFNGTALLQKRGVRVITSAQTLKLIPSVHELRKGWFYERFKPDYPEAEPKPESFGSETTEIEAAGLKLKLHVLGKGASDTHVAVEYDGNLFVGDLVTIGFHSWLEKGYLKEWLKTLAYLQDLKPEIVRTGRGGSGDADSIQREMDYLEEVIKVVKAAGPKRGQALSPEIRAKIQKRIETLYPAYDYPMFISNGLTEIWKNLAR